MTFRLNKAGPRGLDKLLLDQLVLTFSGLDLYAGPVPQHAVMNFAPKSEKQMTQLQVRWSGFTMLDAGMKQKMENTGHDLNMIEDYRLTGMGTARIIYSLFRNETISDINVEDIVDIGALVLRGIKSNTTTDKMPNQVVFAMVSDDAIRSTELGIEISFVMSAQVEKERWLQTYECFLASLLTAEHWHKRVFGTLPVLKLTDEIMKHAASVDSGSRLHRSKEEVLQSLLSEYDKMIEEAKNSPSAIKALHNEEVHELIRRMSMPKPTNPDQAGESNGPV